MKWPGTTIFDTQGDQLGVGHNPYLPRLLLEPLDGFGKPLHGPIELDRLGVAQLAEQLIKFLRDTAEVTHT
jgi:hypothetical protein